METSLNYLTCLESSVAWKSEVAEMFRRVYTTKLVKNKSSIEVFLFGRALEIIHGRFFVTMAMLPRIRV